MKAATALYKYDGDDLKTVVIDADDADEYLKDGWSDSPAKPEPVKRTTRKKKDPEPTDPESFL